MNLVTKVLQSGTSKVSYVAYGNSGCGFFKHTKLDRFLPKNQHAQGKLFNFENWISGGLGSFQKSEF